MNQQITDYLSQNKDQYSQDQLVEQLRSAGYDEGEISEGIAYIYKLQGQPVIDNSSISTNANFSKKGEFAMSWALVRASFKILRQDKEIVLFPIISSIVSIIALVTFFVPTAILLGVFTGVEVLEEHRAVIYLILFFYYLITYFIVAFFNSALVSCVMVRLQGGDPTFRGGLRVAVSHIGKIFFWAVISATVGVLLRAVISQASERFGFVGQITASIAGGLAGFAWTLLTYFVVPVIIIEHLSPKDAIKQSGALFKKTWGENMIGNISMRLFFLAMIIPAMIIAFGVILAFQSAGVMIFCLIVFVLFLAIISSAMKGIFTTALYLYAKTGVLPQNFDANVILHAFKQKPAKKKLFG